MKCENQIVISVLSLELGHASFTLLAVSSNCTYIEQVRFNWDLRTFEILEISLVNITLLKPFFLFRRMYVIHPLHTNTST